ncbi:septum site-determining protein MinC [uncultured Chloroflexus sp.]|uniref:septum site-determining protein MinC n=1 Tax=uncultured Chloroflexus sp. TaxID=214040 RepID=UPI00262CCDD8|nr:septum site-determining protein MinC [uncultured Chloroflexus sp.]
MSDLITIKGSRDGLRLRLDATAAWPELLSRLDHHLGERRGFFHGASLVIDLGDREVSPEQLDEMLALIRQHGVQATAIDSSDRVTRAAARTVGLTARPLPRYSEPAPVVEAEALLMMRTLRSGQVLRHTGHITLIGDVNPGAEIIAGGSVVVWGRLRGLVHAGALGDSSAIICALELNPTQLRIANLIARAPDRDKVSRPEFARVVAGEIVVDGWETFKR